MTAREVKIAKSILNVLHELDGGQAHALTIHAEIGGLNACTTADFDSVLAAMDSQKFVIGIKTQFKGTMWSISDLGEAVRLKM